MTQEQMAQVIGALARTAFLVHAKANGTIEPEKRWTYSPGLRELWGGITLGIIEGASTAAETAAGKPQPGMPLPGLGMPLGAALPALGPTSPLSGSPHVITGDPKALPLSVPYPPSKPPEGEPITPHPTKDRGPDAIEERALRLAYDNGASAARKGVRRIANPYSDGNGKHRQEWFRGFDNTTDF